MTQKPTPSQVYKFRASSLRDAIDIVREEFGPDAQVLRTREVKRDGLMNRLMGKRDIEVTVASAEYDFDGRQSEGSQNDEPSRNDYADSHNRSFDKEVDDSFGLDLSSMRDETYNERDFQNGRMISHSDTHHDHDELEKIKHRLRNAFRSQENHVEQPAPVPESFSFNTLSAWPDAAFRIYTDLLEADVANDLAREAIQAVLEHLPQKQQSNERLLRETLQQLLQSWLPTSGAIRIRDQQRVVALIGPTGVGKTTTIAKIAANTRLIEKRRVGLITMDTYRIAAVEQLRTYAEIIDLPLFVATNPREVRDAMQKLDDCELILIDTAGRSPKDDAQICELEKMLAAAQPDETHLVLSCSQSANAMVKTANRFARANFSHLLLTKLDEALALGPILSLSRAVERPISYVTTGQNVPDDIEIAESAVLVERILNADLNQNGEAKYVA